MKYILLIGIRIYWKVMPISKRRACLFKVSCSHYVYRETKEEGLMKGLRALIYRFKSCKSGSMLFENPITQKAELLLTTGEILGNEFISDHVLSKPLLNGPVN
jgi:putative component of membrane protein insertase Oxa1/YidC/SpoIIIJ protein YidD